MVTAFTAVPAMFGSAKLGSSSFIVSGVSPSVAPSKKTARVTMAVDPFQRKFQSFGRINVDYKRPKNISDFKRAGTDARPVGYPKTVSMAGHYPISFCGKPAGSFKIKIKFDEYCAKAMLHKFKSSAAPYGYYTPKCTEATTHGAADGKRVFNLQQAFRQNQKPIGVRMAERFAARRAAIIMTNGCHHEERQFSGMPMSCATYLAGTSEATGACIRTVLPNSSAETYMATGIRSQLLQKKIVGEYPVGVCMDGQVKGQAEDRRVAALASQFRAQQQDAGTVHKQKYEARHLANKLFYHGGCEYEEGLFSAYPSTAAAMMRY